MLAPVLISGAYHASFNLGDDGMMEESQHYPSQEDDSKAESSSL
jgi:hypothetical protein